MGIDQPKFLIVASFGNLRWSGQFWWFVNLPPVFRSADWNRTGVSASVEAKFFLTLDLNDTRILNHNFDRAERYRTHRADNFANSASLMVV